MNETQQQLLSMFKDLGAILDSHKIPYYLAYGSAIGAVRHGGFIPWDDDIDILVWNEDIPKINDIVSKEIGGKYYFHNPKADTRPHMVLRTKNFEEDLKNKKAPFIDIFPLKRFPSTKGRQFFSYFTIWGIHCAVTMMNFGNSVWIYRHLLKLPQFFVKLSDMFADESSKLCVAYTTNFAREVVPVDWYGTPVECMFEDMKSYLPAENDKILTQYFGNYMAPSPENKRKGANGYPFNIYKDYFLDKKNTVIQYMFCASK